MPEDLTDTLDRARQDAMLSIGALWVRYFGLGGMGTALELEAYLFGALRPTAHEYDVLAQTLNERFDELGADRTIPYSDD
ncbi:MAG TPA: hypothetical protein VKX24_01175 [Acidimicrobiia bacterium]|nr:hypothetical protein [Acidimicrobiia bacterium]